CQFIAQFSFCGFAGFADEACQSRKRQQLARRKKVCEGIHAIDALRECATRSFSTPLRCWFIWHERETLVVCRLATLKRVYCGTRSLQVEFGGQAIVSVVLVGTSNHYGKKTRIVCPAATRFNL